MILAFSTGSIAYGIPALLSDGKRHGVMQTFQSLLGIYLLIILYITSFSPTYNLPSNTPTINKTSNMESTPTITHFYFNIPYNEVNNTAKIISCSLKQLLADDTTKCLSIPSKKPGFWIVCYGIRTFEANISKKLQELEHYLQVMQAQLELAPNPAWYTLPLKCQYRSNKVGSCLVDWYDAGSSAMDRNTPPKLFYILDSMGDGLRLDSSARHLDDGLLIPPIKRWGDSFR